MLSMWKLLLLIISCGLLVSCTEPPPDVFACEELKSQIFEDPETSHFIFKPSPTCMKKIGEDSCGHCTKIVSGEEIYVGEYTKLNGKSWSELRDGSILLPAEESYAPLAAYIINMCKKMKCSDIVTKFKVKLDGLKPVEK